MLHTPLLDSYIDAHASSENPLLSQLDRETNLRFLQPNMVSGNVQAQFLQLICGLQKPKTILEIGTYTGYSAMAMAMAAPESCVLHTIDVNPELQTIHEKYREKSGLDKKIINYYGKAVDILPKIMANFDLVFIDADKENYSRYYHLIIDKVPRGGIIIADNVLWKGKVLEAEKDKKTQALHLFNQEITQDARVTNFILPLRDGLMIMIKN